MKKLKINYDKLDGNCISERMFNLLNTLDKDTEHEYIIKKGFHPYKIKVGDFTLGLSNKEIILCED